MKTISTPLVRRSSTINMTRKFIKIIIFFIIFFHIYQCKSTFLLKSDTLDLAIDKISDLHLYQISVFRDEETKGEALNSILGKIASKIPTFIIGNDETKVLNHTEEMMRSREALNADLYVMVKDVDYFSAEKFESYLNLIAESNPLPPRAKFVLTLIGNFKLHQVNFKNLFITAWDMRFLDFSVMLVNGIDDPVILNYNPFFDNDYCFHNISSKPLFPDKLSNMNEYKVKTVLFQRPPFIEFVNESNKLTTMGLHHDFMKLTSEALNFRHDFIRIQDFISEVDLFDMVEKGEIDISIKNHALGVQLSSYKGSFLAGRPLREANFHLIVPILYKNTDNKLEIYLKIGLQFCFTASIMLLIMLVVKVFRLKSGTWTPLYVFALLFGITVDKRPHRLIERMIYFYLAVLSIQYSSDVFAVISDDAVLMHEEIIFDAHEEIRHPTFPIYLDASQFQKKADASDEIFYNLQTHAKILKSYDDCFKTLPSQKNHFCFGSEFFGKDFIKKHRNPDNTAAMKLAYPIVVGDFFVHIYAKGSPYIRKFEKKFVQVFEAGLQDSIYHGKKYIEGDKKSNDDDITHKPIDSINLELTILMVGCILGILTFAFELIILIFKKIQFKSI